MNEQEDGIKNMALGHKYFGCHVNADNSFVIRQWAPGKYTEFYKYDIHTYVNIRDIR